MSSTKIGVPQAHPKFARSRFTVAVYRSSFTEKWGNYLPKKWGKNIPVALT